MNIELNRLEATEIAKAKNIRLWYWPRIANPYRVHIRFPGHPYALYAAYATKAEALASFQKLCIEGF